MLRLEYSDFRPVESDPPQVKPDFNGVGKKSVFAPSSGYPVQQQQPNRYSDEHLRQMQMMGCGL